MIVSVSEAKAHLSELIERAYRGQLVTIAKNRTPLVDIVPHRLREPRRLGLADGSACVPDDFDAPCPQIEHGFYGT
jgi:prevent-host-death family protein